ncbi:MAG: VWA domain-containing protein [Rikenellaceae bacterium]
MKNQIYSAPITRNTPAMIGFVLDLSGSMCEEVYYEGCKMTKCVALSTIVNRTIYEIVSSCNKCSSHYNYFEFMAIGYSENSIVNLFEDTIGDSSIGNDFYSVNDIVSASVENVIQQRKIINSSGENMFAQYKVPQYIHPTASGSTPMYKALKKAYDLTKFWIDEHSDTRNFPPMIIHITDGESTDAPMSDVVTLSQKIKSLHTPDGNVLFLNIHVIGSQEENNAIKFPSHKDELQPLKNAQYLFDMSSIFPKNMLKMVREVKNAVDIEEVINSRMMTFNSNIATILEAINIGTVTLTKNL